MPVEPDQNVSAGPLPLESVARKTTAAETISLLEEVLQVGKRQVETGRVRISLLTDTEQRAVTETLRSRRVDVQRVTVERLLDAGEAMPQSRMEGDELVVPIVEKRLVLEKRLVVTRSFESAWCTWKRSPVTSSRSVASARLSNTCARPTKTWHCERLGGLHAAAPGHACGDVLLRLIGHPQSGAGTRRRRRSHPVPRGRSSREPMLRAGRVRRSHGFDYGRHGARRDPSDQNAEHPPEGGRRDDPARGGRSHRGHWSRCDVMTATHTLPALQAADPVQTRRSLHVGQAPGSGR